MASADLLRPFMAERVLTSLTAIKSIRPPGHTGARWRGICEGMLIGIMRCYVECGTIEVLAEIVRVADAKAPQEERHAMSIGSLWVLGVMAFWGVVFLLMIYFSALISHGRDGEETTCDLPPSTVTPTDTTATAATHAPA